MFVHAGQQKPSVLLDFCRLLHAACKQHSCQWEEETDRNPDRDRQHPQDLKLLLLQAGVEGDGDIQNRTSFARMLTLSLRGLCVCAQRVLNGKVFISLFSGIKTQEGLFSYPETSSCRVHCCVRGNKTQQDNKDSICWREGSKEQVLSRG